MKLKQIHIGAFGGLNDCKKNLEAGFNVVYGENGAGKSTFLGFIKTCLYGFQKKGREKYLPWNGSASHGSMVYEQDGTWVYQAKFGKTKKGDRITLFNELTGEDCSVPESLGRDLFSMGEETFSKTACVSQGQMTITKDNKDEIAEKLANLEHTGESNLSYAACKKLLDGMESELRKKRGSGGLLNDAEQKVEEYRERERKVSEKSAIGARLYRQISDARIQLEQLQMTEQQWEEYEKYEKKQRCMEYKQKIEQLLPLAEQGEEEYEIYEMLAEDWKQEEENLRILTNQKSPLPEMGQPLCTSEEFTRIMAGKKRPVFWCGLFGLGAIICALCSALFSLLFLIPAVLLLGAVLFMCLRPIAQPWEAYGYQSAEEFSRNYASSLEQQSQYEAAVSQQKKIEEQLEAQKRKTEEYREKGKRLGCETPEQLKTICNERRKRQAKRNTAKEQLKTYETLLKQALDGEELDEVCKAKDAEKPSLDRQRITALQVELTGQIEQLSAEQKHLYDESPEVIAALRTEWEQKRDQYREQEQVLQIVSEVLESAYNQMEQQFGGNLNQRAGELLGRMTEGKYTNPRISRSYEVKLTEGSGTYSLEQFSSGLYDQTYLAFRLAMLELMKTGAPLLLDDILMQYDDKRAEKTIEMLEEFSEETGIQVLLFTCRNRDFQLAKNRKKINCIEIL